MATKLIHVNTITMDKGFKNKLALERGKRVKLARNLTGLTRKDFFDKYNVNPNTICAWEKGNNLLTENKASTLVDIFSQEGVNLTKEWLLYGEDPGLINKSGINYTNQDLNAAIKLRGDLKIQEEIKFFLDNNLNSISCLIVDESLYPMYCAGDYVGGIKFIGKKIIELVGEFCIVITNEEMIFAKKIFLHKEKNVFIVGDINPITNLNAPHHFTCEIQAAAKITRHWHLGSASTTAKIEDC